MKLKTITQLLMFALVTSLLVACGSSSDGVAAAEAEDDGETVDATISAGFDTE